MNAQEMLIALVQVLAAGGGAWLAVRIEMKWLRTDLNRHERLIDSHDSRLRELELQ